MERLNLFTSEVWSVMQIITSVSVYFASPINMLLRRLHIRLAESSNEKDGMCEWAACILAQTNNPYCYICWSIKTQIMNPLWASMTPMQCLQKVDWYMLSLSDSIDLRHVLNQQKVFNMLPIKFLLCKCDHITNITSINTMVGTRGFTMPVYSIINHQCSQLIMMWYTAHTLQLQSPRELYYPSTDALYGHERRAECSHEIVGREMGELLGARAVRFTAIILTRLIYCLLYLMRVHHREKRRHRRRDNRVAERCNEML